MNKIKIEDMKKNPFGQFEHSNLWFVQVDNDNELSITINSNHDFFINNGCTILEYLNFYLNKLILNI